MKATGIVRRIDDLGRVVIPKETNSLKQDGKDTWFEYGIGANFNLSESTYLWADVERTSGGIIDQEWRATIGVRYGF